MKGQTIFSTSQYTHATVTVRDTILLIFYKVTNTKLKEKLIGVSSVIYLLVQAHFNPTVNALELKLPIQPPLLTGMTVIKVRLMSKTKKNPI